MHSWIRGVIALFAVATAALALSSCSKNASPGSPSQATTSASCRASSTATPAVPVVVQHQGGGTSVFVAVCVDGHGPYRFLLDTGASVSLVDAALVASLHLPKAPPAPRRVGVGCTATAKQIRLSSWSVGGLELAGQNVLTANVAGFGLNGAPAGVLGSDVLSRFGAVRVDYHTKQLTVLTPELAAPTRPTILRGGILEGPPPTLIKQKPQAEVALTVVTFSGSVLATTSVVFSSHGPAVHPFVVNTGSATSSIASPLASSLGLTRAGSTTVATDVGCPAVGQVQSGPWLAGVSVPLAPSPLARVDAPTATAEGVEGNLGSDLLGRYGSIVLDYRSALLWLGAG